MPTYEYRCKDCGEHLEVVQSFRDDPLTECPACTGTLKKVFQPVGIAFKGTGFYRNDARSGSSSSSSSSSSTTSTSDGASSSSGSSSDGGSGSSSTNGGSSTASTSSSDTGSSSKATSSEAKSA